MLDMFKKPFPCTGCGGCCRRAGLAIEMAKKVPEDQRTPIQQEQVDFPFGYDKTGRCEKLGDDNQCTVYEDRPNICDIFADWKRHYKPKGVKWNELKKEVATICNIYVKQDRLPDKFLVKL